MKNLYNVLNIDRTATQDQIKLSYKSLVRENHPDLGGDPEKCKEINVAYGILSDPAKRKEYDGLSMYQQEDKYRLIKEFFKLFLYKDKEFDILLDFFFYNDLSKKKVYKSGNQPTKKKENSVKSKVVIILDIDEAYNKKYYKYTHNKKDYVVPVVNGEYSFEDEDSFLKIEVDIISSPTIKIKDNDIVVEEFIDIHDYIYGYNLELKLPNGVKIDKRIESFLHRETIELIEGEGLYYIDGYYNGNLSDIEFKRGDIYIDFKVKNVDGTNYKDYTELKQKIKDVCKK